jgi:hypothetical protein
MFYVKKIYIFVKKIIIMKILKSEIKIRSINIKLEEQIIDIVYEKGISVQTLNITIEQGKEIGFIDFEKLNKIL